MFELAKAVRETLTPFLHFCVKNVRLSVNTFEKSSEPIVLEDSSLQWSLFFHL